MTHADSSLSAANLAAQLDEARAQIAELKRSVERYQGLFELSNDAVFIHDHEGRLLDANERAVEMLGYSRAELLAMSVPDFHPPEALEDALAAFGELAKVGHARLRSKFKTASGAVIDVEITVRAITRHPTVFQGMARDITAKKRAEEALAESESLHRSILLASPDGITITDLEGRIRLVSPSVVRLLGYARDGELIGRSMLELLAPDDRERAAGNVALMFQGVFTGPADYRALCADGALLHIEVNGEYARDAAGTPSGMVFVSRDISDRKRAEQERAKLEAQLYHAQKMESVGRLAGGVAHDFNNMLGVILGHAELALEELGPTLAVRDDLEEIQKAAMRSADLTRQLLAFARKQPVAPKVLDLNVTVTGMLKMLQRLIAASVRLEWLPEVALWPVRIDPSQVDQILANLCVNARDAMSDTGTLTLETANVTVRDDEDDDAAPAGAVPGDYVRLTVRDDGCGMPREIQAHLFEPFFTTKPVGEGTGLGLATVYGIVKQNRGFIQVSSAPGQGTTFQLFLPRCSTTAEAPPEAAGAGELAAVGRDTILLMDGEEAVQRLTTRMLEALGYAVLVAGDRAAAGALAREHRGVIALLVTGPSTPWDVARDLAAEVASLHPRMKCLFVSSEPAGHGDADARARGAALLQSPFSRQDLAAKVHALLDGGRAV
jgi:PAS domain S-box-containing protein